MATATVFDNLGLKSRLAKDLADRLVPLDERQADYHLFREGPRFEGPWRDQRPIVIGNPIPSGNEELMLCSDLTAMRRAVAHAGGWDKVKLYWLNHEAS